MIQTPSIIDYFLYFIKTISLIIFLPLIIFLIFFFLKSKNIKKAITIFLSVFFGFFLLSLIFGILVYMDANNISFLDKTITFEDIKNQKAQDILIFETGNKDKIINFDTGFKIKEDYKYNEPAFYINIDIVNREENNSNFDYYNALKEKIESESEEYSINKSQNIFITKQGLKAVEYFDFAILNIPIGSKEKYLHISKVILVYTNTGYVKIRLIDKRLKISNKRDILNDALEKIMNNDDKKGEELFVFKEIFNKIKETVDVDENKLLIRAESKLNTIDETFSKNIDSLSMRKNDETEANEQEYNTFTGDGFSFNYPKKDHCVLENDHIGYYTYFFIEENMEKAMEFLNTETDYAEQKIFIDGIEGISTQYTLHGSGRRGFMTIIPVSENKILRVVLEIRGGMQDCSVEAYDMIIESLKIK